MSRNIMGRDIFANFISVGPICILNFANNEITSVPYNFFSNLSTLEELDLGQKSIQDFDFNVSALCSLKNLNLEYNKISEISEATRQQLIQQAEHVAPQIVTVDLSNNSLSCSCSSIRYLTFMHQTKPSNLVFYKYDEYMCHDQAGNLVFFAQDKLVFTVVGIPGIRSVFGNWIWYYHCCNHHSLSSGCDYLQKALVVPLSIFPGTPYLEKLPHD